MCECLVKYKEDTPKYIYVLALYLLNFPFFSPMIQDKGKCL